MLADKKLTDYTNLFSSYDFDKNDSIILSYFTTWINTNDWVKQFVEKGYKESIIRNQIKKARDISTLSKKSNAVQKNVIPFSVKYSSALPNIREIINKHWHLLNINNTFQNISTQHPS